MDEPDPTYVPPHEPEYHSQEAPVPKLPPLTLKVEVPPTQMFEFVPLIDDAAVDKVLTITCILAHPVVLQNPSDLT
jgi:hypothetical protein